MQMNSMLSMGINAFQQRPSLGKGQKPNPTAQNPQWQLPFQGHDTPTTQPDTDGDGTDVDTDEQRETGMPLWVEPETAPPPLTVPNERGKKRRKKGNPDAPACLYYA